MDNPDGTYALFEQTASSHEELERYDTAEAAKEAAGELLLYDPRTLYVVERGNREEVFRIAWPGRPKVEDPEPASDTKTVATKTK